jgi:hypothetical protein
MTKLTGMAELIRPSTVLPHNATPFSFITSDGLQVNWRGRITPQVVTTL